MSEYLLPPNATDLERALAAAVVLPLPVPNADLWNPDKVPAAFLPWLAHTLSIDIWNSRWPETVRREVLRASVRVHRVKGTRAAIKAVLEATGFGGATITEGFGGYVHDGTIAYDGSADYGNSDGWAEYRVYLARPITASQAVELRRILSLTAPARCRLAGLYFTEAPLTYDATASYSGAYNYGAA